MIFNSIEKHLYTIIILHGMFQTYKDLIPLKTAIQKHNKNHKTSFEKLLGLKEKRVLSNLIN